MGKPWPVGVSVEPLCTWGKSKTGILENELRQSSNNYCRKFNHPNKNAQKYGLMINEAPAPLFSGRTGLAQMSREQLVLSLQGPVERIQKGCCSDPQAASGANGFPACQGLKLQFEFSFWPLVSSLYSPPSVLRGERSVFSKKLPSFRRTQCFCI